MLKKVQLKYIRYILLLATMSGMIPVVLGQVAGRFANSEAGKIEIKRHASKEMLYIPTQVLGKEILVIGDKTKNRKTRVIRFRQVDSVRVDMEQPFYLMRAMESGPNGLQRNVDISNYPLFFAKFLMESGSNSAYSQLNIESFLLGKDTIFDAKKTVQSHLIVLPEKPMPIYFADPRVGFEQETFIDFDNPKSGLKQSIVSRFRLEPKLEEVSRYKAGEIVDPQQRLVFYLDPSIPVAWIPVFEKAVEAWQQAFEKAGFRQAIVARTLTGHENAPSNSLAGYGVIRLDSTAKEASVEHFTDPRTGEILLAKIVCSASTLQGLIDAYLVQMGLLGACSEKEMSTLQATLIQQEVSKLVGRALGLKANLYASSTMGIKQLSSRSYLAKNSMTPSIMDEIGCNYVLQPGTKWPAAYQIPQIGAYDHWAIEWAYRWQKPETIDQIARYTWVNQTLAKNDQLLYSASENDKGDAKARPGDLSDDPIAAAYLGMKNLNRSAQYIRAYQMDHPTDTLRINKWKKILVDQYSTLLNNACAVVQGEFQDPVSYAATSRIKGYLPKKRKQEALRFITKFVFDSLILDQLVNIETVQSMVLKQLLSPITYSAMQLASYRLPQRDQYTFDQMLTDFLGSNRGQGERFKSLVTQQLESLSKGKDPQLYEIRAIAIEQLQRYKK